MRATEFYYGKPGGEMQGPLEWDVIRAAYHSGKLGGETLVAKSSAGPWVSIVEVENRGFAAFKTISGNTVEPESKPVAASEPHFEEPGIALGLGVLGVFGVAVSLIMILAGFVTRNEILGASGGASLVSSMALIGIGKAVTYAAEAVYLLKTRK